jgi:hypothetical protein
MVVGAGGAISTYDGRNSHRQIRHNRKTPNRQGDHGDTCTTPPPRFFARLETKLSTRVKRRRRRDRNRKYRFSAEVALKIYILFLWKYTTSLEIRY